MSDKKCLRYVTWIYIAIRVQECFAYSQSPKLRTELLMTVIYCTSAFITMFMYIYRDACRIELSESGNSYLKELNFQAKSCRPYTVI